MDTRFDHLLEIYAKSQTRDEITGAKTILDKIKHEELILRDRFNQEHKGFFMDGIRNFEWCVAESIAAEGFGLYRLANVALRTGLDDFQYRVFFQIKLDTKTSINLTKFDETEIENELLRRTISVVGDGKMKQARVEASEVSGYYFYWSLGQTKSFPKIDLDIVPNSCKADWNALMASLNRDTHNRSNIFERVSKQDSGYIGPVEDVEKVMFNEQQIKHWNKNIKQSYDLFVKIKDSYLSQYSKPK